MNKTRIFLLLLLLITLTLFFIGAVSLRVRPNTYGVMHSRIGGYSSTVLESGTFRWSALPLVPYTFTIIELPSASRTVEIPFTSTLPDSQKYRIATFADADFSFSCDLEIGYGLNRETMVEQVEHFGITSQSSYQWFASFESKVRQAATYLIEDYFAGHTTSSSIDDTSELAAILSDYLRVALQDYFPELQFTDVRLIFTDSADLGVYREARALYEFMQSRKREALQQMMEDYGPEAAEQALYFDRLQSLGMLLETYPNLLDYLRLEDSIPH